MTLGQGIMRGMEQFGQGLQSYAGDMAQWKTKAKVADSLHQYLEDQRGDDDTTPNPLGAKDQWAGYGYRDKVAAMEGFMRQRDDQMFKARLGEYLSQADQRKQQVADEQSAGQFLQQYFNANAPVSVGQVQAMNAGQGPRRLAPGEAPEPLTAEAKLRFAAANTPGMSGRIMPRVIDSLVRYEQLLAKPEAAGTPGTVTDIPGLPGRKFVWQTSKSGTAIETGAAGIPPKPTLPAEPGFAWAYKGPDQGWKMEQLRVDNLPPATTAKLDSLTAQEQAILTEMSQPYKKSWPFGESIEARTKRLESALAGIRSRKAQLLDPRSGTPAPAAGKSRFTIVSEE